jgi:large conductance mechanosensitive channel
MIEGFKTFLMRGNVVDLAVGVIIGAAFAKITDGFMKSLVEPLIKLALGSADPAKAFETVAIGPFPVGVLLAAIVNFILIAAVVYFFIVTPMNAMKKPAAAAAPAAPTKDQELLGEIRDLLKKQAR